MSQVLVGESPKAPAIGSEDWKAEMQQPARRSSSGHDRSSSRTSAQAARWLALFVPIWVLLLAAAGAVSQANAASQTTVSLTFDDGDATQYAVRSMLSSHAMHATFS
jgi:hypothetical protein